MGADHADAGTEEYVVHPVAIVPDAQHLRPCGSSIAANRYPMADVAVLAAEHRGTHKSQRCMHGGEAVGVGMVRTFLRHAPSERLRQADGQAEETINLSHPVGVTFGEVFVDGDDRLMTEPYNHCLDILRSHEDADMVVFDFTSSTDVSTTYTDGPVLSGTDFMRHHNIHGSACLYLFRQKTLSELCFTPGIFHEDEEFTPQLLLRAEHVYPTDAHAYYYCQRPNSITSTTDEQKVQKRLDDLHAITHRLYLLADRLPLNDRLALRRRVAQLTMDYLYQIIMQTRSAQQLDTRIAMLRSEGLFPLPDEDYSQKYVWFRRMTSTALGRALLLHSLPLLRKER